MTEETIKVFSIYALGELLEQHGINLHKYGKGEAKTVQHLFDEIRKRECTLKVEDSALIRRVRVAVLRIMLPDGRFLRELYQEFIEDGRRRTRTLDGTAGEKLKAGESPREAVTRLVREEFPLLRGANTREVEVVTETDSRQKSYPGLVTIYEKIIFVATLPEDPEQPTIIVVEPDKFVGYGPSEAWLD